MTFAQVLHQPGHWVMLFDKPYVCDSLGPNSLPQVVTEASKPFGFSGNPHHCSCYIQNDGVSCGPISLGHMALVNLRGYESVFEEFDARFRSFGVATNVFWSWCGYIQEATKTPTVSVEGELLRVDLDVLKLERLDVCDVLYRSLKVREKMYLERIGRLFAVNSTSHTVPLSSKTVSQQQRRRSAYTTRSTSSKSSIRK